MNTISLNQRVRLLAEVAAFVALAFLSKALIHQITWRFSGPISLVMLLGVMTIYLRRKGVTWEMLGMRRLPGLKAKLMVVPQALLTFCAFAAAVGTVLALSHLLSLDFMNEIPEGVEERWADVEGNLPQFLLWLGIVWTAAAFGEEMFFRGYLVTRLRQAFDGWKFAPVLAVLVAALLFGYAHYYYQGLRGFITTGMIGVAFGASFLLLKRNLWPIILLHGIINTLSFTALYLGLE